MTTKKSTSGNPPRRLGVQRQEKGRQILGARGKASDAVRAQILKNTAGAKPVEPDDVGHIIMVEGHAGTALVKADGTGFFGGGPAVEYAKNWMIVGIGHSGEGGVYSRTGFGKATKLKSVRVGVSPAEGFKERVEIVHLHDLAGAVHAIWDRPSGFLRHEHPSSTISVELAEHEIGGELTGGPHLREPVEQRFNLDLHSLEGVDTRGLEYPGSDEPAELPDWPAELSVAPYKMK